MRRGSGFGFVDRAGAAADVDTRQRAIDLVIPPAWQDEWISPHPNGHIQAVGTDDAGRRQYRYHAAWHEARGREKHDRVMALAKKRPQARKQVADLRSDGLTRARVTAAALGRDERPAAGARVVLSLKRSSYPGERLLAYRDEQGQWHELHSADLNAAVKELVGAELTVKGLRNWAATVTASVTLAQTEPVDSERELKRAERDAMKVVSQHLGNTPAVARRSYVDTRVRDEHGVGRAIARSLTRLSKADRERLAAGELVRVRDRDALERAVIRLLRAAY